MNYLNYHVLSYFHYDLEKLLDEFNNYYTIKQYEIPTYYQTIFMYFTHLSEIGLQILIKSQFNVKDARQMVQILPAHLRLYTEQDFIQNMQQLRLPPIHYYGLFIYSYYFYEIYIDYLKNNYEKSLNHLASQLPIVEANIHLLNRIIRQQR